ENHVKDKVFKGLIDIYKLKEEQVGYEHLRYLEKMLLLHTIDSKWKDHLYAMDQLKEGIGLRSFAQRDPLIEYKREGFEMFQVMYDSVGFEVAETIFKIQPAKVSHPMRGVFSSLPQQMIHDSASGLGNAASRYRPEAVGAGIDQIVPPPTFSTSIGLGKGQKVGRNDPCSCGSGKKYKKCCGR
ncbi:MAG: SEC-C domain-containing protein, partial [Candidatus Omnitrophica bacterium]|nr:SEC-C domain-containing protein [Candidatus Omnitrophota bacterium]